jgi:hypothetical protein
MVATAWRRRRRPRAQPAGPASAVPNPGPCDLPRRRSDARRGPATAPTNGAGLQRRAQAAERREAAPAVGVVGKEEIRGRERAAVERRGEG